MYKYEIASMFHQGNRVYHRLLQEYGTVDRVLDGTVNVTYDPGKLKGEYDQDWFRLHPDLLVKTDRA